VDLIKFMTPTSLVLNFNGIPMMNPANRRGINEEGMSLNVFDDDPLSFRRRLEVRPWAAASLGLSRTTSSFMRRAKFQLIVV